MLNAGPSSLQNTLKKFRYSGHDIIKIQLLISYTSLNVSAKLYYVTNNMETHISLSLLPHVPAVKGKVSQMESILNCLIQHAASNIPRSP